MAPTTDPLAGLKTKRHDLEAWLEACEGLQTLSLSRSRLHAGLEEAICSYGRSPLLDAGAGRAPFRGLYQSMDLQVTLLDKEARSAEVQLIGDVQEMTQVGDAAFASVVCSQVLEHVPDPWAAVAEMARVLRPGGTLILSVPHLSMLHEVPHDYWRFTCFGLAQLLERAGMQVVSITPTAGVLAFAGHLLSLAWMLTAGSLPGFRRAAWKINAALLIKLLGRLDRKFGAAGILPCDYVAVARKREP
jgi:SAM-dependent methyltransferase